MLGVLGVVYGVIGVYCWMYWFDGYWIFGFFFLLSEGLKGIVFLVFVVVMNILFLFLKVVWSRIDVMFYFVGLVVGVVVGEWILCRKEVEKKVRMELMVVRVSKV